MSTYTFHFNNGETLALTPTGDEFAELGRLQNMNDGVLTTSDGLTIIYLKNVCYIAIVEG